MRSAGSLAGTEKVGEEDRVPSDSMMPAECIFSTVLPKTGAPKCQPHPRPVGATAWGF